MTQDDIIDIAKQAGFMQHLGVIAIPNIQSLNRFVSLISGQEREACASTCEQAGIDGLGTLAAAALIRKRGYE
jgi:hypothetical protein